MCLGPGLNTWLFEGPFNTSNWSLRRNAKKETPIKTLGAEMGPNAMLKFVLSLDPQSGPKRDPGLVMALVTRPKLGRRKVGRSELHLRALGEGLREHIYICIHIYI